MTAGGSGNQRSGPRLMQVRHAGLLSLPSAARLAVGSGSSSRNQAEVAGCSVTDGPARPDPSAPDSRRPWSLPVNLSLGKRQRSLETTQLGIHAFRSLGMADAGRRIDARLPPSPRRRLASV